MNILHKMKDLSKNLPILGGLVETRPKDHKEAFVEVGLNVVLSTIPIWLGALVMLADLQNPDTYWINFIDNMQNGELYLYSTAMLAPLYYFIFKEVNEFPNFPSSRMFMIVSALIVFVCTAFFTIQKAKSIFGFEQRLDQEFVFSWSWKIYFVSICVVYVAHVYKHLRETGAAEVSMTSTRDFAQAFRDRERGK